MHERWIPVLREQEVCGFPKYPTASLHHMAEHMSLEDALTRRFAFDAHILAHSNPEVDRRIDQGVFADADALAKIGGAVRMVLLIADVDCDKSHKASGSTGDAPAPDVWRCDEIPKVEALRRVHPDVYSYDTKGGYRLLGWLPTPVLLKSKADADEWSRRYCEWLAYLQIQFQIFADPACKNFGRFQRLPHATRGANAAPEERATIGDPHAIGTIRLPRNDYRDHGACEHALGQEGRCVRHQEEEETAQARRAPRGQRKGRALSRLHGERRARP